MTPRTRKIVHAGLVALAAAVSDVGVQFMTADPLARGVATGLLVGVFARTLGAVLAYVAAEDE